MTTQQLVFNIRDNFVGALQAKTSWGKNEMARLLDVAIAEESLKALKALPDSVVKYGKESCLTE